MNNYIFVTIDDGINITYTITAATKAALKTQCSDSTNAQTVFKSSLTLSEAETWTAADCVDGSAVTGTIYRAA